MSERIKASEKRMKLLNFGSINVDNVYAVEHFVRPGETLNGSRYNRFAGGKGFNQSIALARAGVRVLHAGMVGTDGAWLIQRLKDEGIDTRHVATYDGPTGHALIQVIPSGENAIVLYGGANRQVPESLLENAFEACSPGDYFLVQNETSRVGKAIRRAAERNLHVVFNPAPMTSEVHDYPLEQVDIFVLNETEAEALSGTSRPAEIRDWMRARYPGSLTVLTLGPKGAFLFDDNIEQEQNAFPAAVIDTTAAGDTFIGFFLGGLMQSGNPIAAMTLANRAAAVCVARPGASVSIPKQNELASPY